MKKRLMAAGIGVMGAMLLAGCTQEKGLPDLELPSTSQVIEVTSTEEKESEQQITEPVAGEVYETLEITWTYDENADEDSCSVYIDMAGVDERYDGENSTSYIAVDAAGNTLYECDAVYGSCKITIYKTALEDGHAYEIRLEPNHPMDMDVYNGELEVIRKATVNGTAIGDENMVRGQTGVWYGLIEKSAD